MDLDPPRLMLVGTRTPNAFALGDTVVLDRALFDLLTLDELEGILAHELAHVENRDGLVSSLVYSVVRTLVGVLALALVPVALLLSGVARPYRRTLVAPRPPGERGGATARDPPDTDERIDRLRERADERATRIEIQ